MISSLGHRLVATWSSFCTLLVFTRLTVGDPASEEGMGARQVDSTSWQKYVRAPSSDTIFPVSVLKAYSQGSITNPDGIINGEGVTTLTRKTSGDELPSIVLDFGQNHVGILSIHFAGSETFSEPGQDSNTSSSTALPGISLAFSESLEYLTNRSDFTRSDNLPDGAKLTTGTDQIAVRHSPYTWTDQLGCQHNNTTSSGPQVCADGLHGFRYLRLTLQALPTDAPYTTPLGSVSIASLSLAFSAFRGTPATFTGWFECSDAALTQWWYDAVYTNDLCTDTFRADDTDPRNAASPSLIGKRVLHDGAKRDRDPYVGDLAVSALTLYLSHHADAAPARDVLADLADHQRGDGWIPPASINGYTLALYDYPLWWVVCSSDLVLYTGDMGYLDEYYGAMVKVLDVYYPNSTNAEGLLEKGLGTSAGYGDYAFLPRSGVITYYNALYVLALQRAAQLAEFKGEDDDAVRWRARAALVGPALIRENWDPSVGALYDGGPCASTGTEKCAVHAQDGNGLAILSGATNNSAAVDALETSTTSSSSSPDESILAYLTKALARPYGNAFYDFSTLSPESQFDQRVYAFISYFELAARFQTSSRSLSLPVPSSGSSDGDGSSSSSTARSISLAATAYGQLRRTFGHMASHDPFSTFWEGIGPNGSYYEQGFTSLAHGWSTCVVPLMQNYVLGVTPTGPGFASFEVRPVTVGGGLSFARGVVPTPMGRIEVEWTVGDVSSGKGLRLTVGGPVGARGMVYVPILGGDTSMMRDGVVIWEWENGVLEGAGEVSVEGGYVVVGLEGGRTSVFDVGT